MKIRKYNAVKLVFINWNYYKKININIIMFIIILIIKISIIELNKTYIVPYVVAIK